MAARRRSSIADDLVLLPWWVSATLAALAYIFLPALLPAPMAKGGLAGIICMFLLAMAAISALRAWKTSHLLESQTGIDSLRELPWKRFEDLLGEAYRRQGYRVEETLGGGPDGGVDLVLRRDGKVTLVQCKRWSPKQRVKVQIVREIYGIVAARQAAAAKVIATTSFTSEAIEFARGKPIELIDAAALLSLLRGVQTSGQIVPVTIVVQDPLAPECPRCSSVMKLRDARRGPNAGNRFWGCSRYPACRGTVSI